MSKGRSSVGQEEEDKIRVKGYLEGGGVEEHDRKCFRF